MGGEGGSLASTQRKGGPDRFRLIPLYYAVAGCAWILASDWLLAALGLSSTLAWLGGTVKGLAFITVTTLLLDALIQHAARRERAQAERARAVFEAAADGILVVAPDGVIRACNGAASEILGRPAVRLVGQPAWTLLPDGTREAWQEMVARTGVSQERETLRGDGTAFPAEWRLTTTLLEREGAVIALVQDQSERKALELQLVQAQKMESVGRLAAGVTHDLNNLLTVVLGRTESLREQHPTGGAQADLLAIERAARRAADLSRHLLTFSRAPVVPASAVDVDRLLQDLEPILAGLAGSSIRLELRRPDRPCLALADESRLEQVVVNLAVNARDAMPGGGHLLVKVVPPDGAPPPDPGLPREPCVTLVVRDTGHGMDERTLSRIFDPFFTTKPPGEGTGLGLSMVYGLVEQFGGAVRVSSQPGRGTEFRVYLPQAREVPEAAPAPPPPPPRAEPSPTVTVLLVEDDAELRDLARRLLERAGHRVLEAASGPEALRVAETQTGFDLLLTDLGLPGMDGAEVARRLAAERSGLRIILMSGYAGGPGAHAGKLPPGTALLEKPFTGRQLLEAIQGALAPP